MAEDRLQPLNPFFAVQDEVRRLFQELVYQPWGGGIQTTIRSWQPRCDLAETEKACIVQTLERCGWNYSRSADALGIGRTTLWRKLKEYGIEAPPT